ncbi:MAG: transporter substrate-binding domain-containing protein [Bdellovibrionales bacterium]|jgi:polar amino acid transport system substrate-binding protein|nr:transporter substrate-binding domain-containing protein [Bdellovibrionales bacterium]MBT3526790.1 transporter substrate-binding domain-containing protein [Bdellovibrionales bacterium]MBT7668349.1 transporter substrate-binding domain-containing protein [Bdellovibrionales bacterium]MBT7766915.1 transporter substrate-binding domain-containing protein [Bdellovibrionales bacterium]
MTTIRTIIVLTLFFVLTSSLLAKPIVFGTQEFPPFSQTKSGKVVGPGVDVIAAVMKRAGLDYKIKSGVWKWIQKSAKDKNGDVSALFFIGKNAAREKWLNFSPPILETTYGFFAKKSSRIKYSNDVPLVNSSIGVYGPSNTSKNLAKIRKKPGNDFKTELYKDSVTVFRVLGRGSNLKFAFSNGDVGRAIIKDEGLDNLQYVGTFKKLNYYFGFSKMKIDAATTKKIMDAYKSLIADGSIARILAGYNMTPAAK